MEIVLTHLTRMGSGSICAAGIASDGTGHVRPLVRSGNLPGRLVARFGGPLRPGARLNLPDGTRRPQPPHVEDYLIPTLGIESSGRVPAGEFSELLEAAAGGTPHDVFGDDLYQIGPRSYGMEQGSGEQSLGYVVCPPDAQMVLRKSSAGNVRPRITFASGGFRYDLAITDTRMFQDDLEMPDSARLQQASKYLGSFDRVFLSVGLTRQLSGVHWLQVNGIFPVANPYWADS